MIILRQKSFSWLSKGYRYLKEIKIIDPLPLTPEEFSIFLFHRADSEKYKRLFPKNLEWRGDESKKLWERVNKYYGKSNASKLLASMGIGFTKSFLFPNDNLAKFLPDYNQDPLFRRAIDYSYERINHIPKRYLFDSLGAGGTGVAFDIPLFDLVEKVSYNGFTLSEFKFYKYIKDNPISVFPRVYDLEPDQVIMEKLLLDTKKVKKFSELIKKYVYKPDPTRIGLKVANFDAAVNDLGINHEFVKFLKSVIEGLKKAYGYQRFENWVGDLAGGNIGERKKTGEIVFFDPAI